jgi:N-hydroxyarylamine O-acetyltransferase
MFNLENYFKYVGLDAFKPEINLDSLTTIVQHHLYHFKYQSTQIYLQGMKKPEDRVIPPLDADYVYDRMVTQRQPAFCYQNIELLAKVLVSCGFQVDRHLARVFNAYEDKFDKVNVSEFPICHTFLMVTIEDKKFIVDTGMASNSFRAPLPFVFSEPQKNGHDTYKIVQFGDQFRINLQLPNGWLTLYESTCKPASINDVSDAYTDLFMTPGKMLVRDDMLLFGYVSETKRKRIVWEKNNSGFFKSFRADNTLKRDTKIQTLEEYTQLVKEKIGVDLVLS